ncbi:MAG TPA: 4a-hydroxytetrahydrobiopterin dehydratase [Burkholderiaceae bacterium]|nr:4a-hydroxytetrahydrobiopterin dehydratase [Burkholderiaceae bacterium]
MKSREALLGLRCRPLSSGAMTTGEVESQLAVLPDWKLVDGAIARAFRFANYYETIAFVNAIAYAAHTEDHHPDLAVGYNRCEVRFSTHSVGGISDNDFICAAKVDAIYAQRAMPRSA